MDEYRLKTSEVFDFYLQKNKSNSIDGMGSVDEIFDRICIELDPFV